MWVRPWPQWPVTIFLCLCLILPLMLINAVHQVEGYCELVLLATNTGSAPHFPVPTHPGPQVHIFGPSSDSAYASKEVSPGQVFVLPKSQLQFEFACVSNAPVNWRYVGPGVSSPDVIFERGRNQAATCFYMSIVFPTAEDEITGQYECYQEEATNVASNFTLFAGNTGNGFLLFRKAGLVVKDSLEAQPILQLPCVTNDPNINMTLWDKVNRDDNNWVEIARDHYTFDPLTGVRLNTTAISYSAVYKCESTFSKQDAAYISYKPPEETLIRPDTDFLRLPSNKSTLLLECYAEVPVTITNSGNESTGLAGLVLEFPTHAQGNRSAANRWSGGRYGYKYGAIVALNFSDVSASNRANSTWNISCVDAGSSSDTALHSWAIRFAKEDFKPGLVFDQATSRATCFSEAPADLNFYYVLCELVTQCQFLDPCLKDSQDWQCPENLAKIPKQISITENSVTVQLQDISGALACIGVDVNQTIYLHRTATSGKLNLDSNQTDLVALNLIGNWEILLGGLVQVECIASKRFFVNNLTFQLWNGDTMVKLLSRDYISTEDNTLIAGMFVRRIQFKMTEFNVDRIVCTAPRYDGNNTVIESVRVKVKKKMGRDGRGDNVNWTAIILGVAAAACLIVMVIVMYCWRATKAKADAAAAMNHHPGIILSEMEFELLQRFREGSPNHLPKANGGGDVDANGTGDEYMKILEDGHYYAQMLPYNTKAHEIDLDRLTIDRRKALGQGEYGIVFQGVYHNGSFGEPVAVKELKPNAQYVCLKALLAEIKIMIYVDHHENIVDFLGACTQSKLEARIVLRLCPHGTLEKYLREHRQTLTYQNVTTLRSQCMNNGSGYVNPTELCVNDLVKWSLQIANALEYLFEKKVIHGDLATRNVLLDETLTAKVSDFGLARQRYTDYDFPKLCEMALPWRWMSIEAIRYLEFSQQSDLWSFGVTMWEIFSLAEIPYSIGQRLTPGFLKDLDDGIRLERPSNASAEVYALMQECWVKVAKDRITVYELKRRLGTMVEAAVGLPAQPINYEQVEFRSPPEV